MLGAPRFLMVFQESSCVVLQFAQINCFDRKLQLSQNLFRRTSVPSTTVFDLLISQKNMRNLHLFQQHNLLVFLESMLETAYQLHLF